MKKRIILLYLIVLSLAYNSFGQSIYANPMQYTPTQLVQDILISGCLQAFNVTYTGDPVAKGYFNDPSGNFAFESGVILTSGVVVPNCYGPNTSTGISSNNTGPSYPLLSSLIPQTSQDCSILEFDFIPSDDTLWFRYIFGSDEYPEFVNTSYNDVFAFFLSGPNPVGGNYVNTNIALIPGTVTPVSINNVNNGSNTPTTGPCVNCAYYIDNTQSTNSPIEMDGYTVPLVAIANVIPCQTYHIILAIGDAGDSALDSNVFLEAGSFTSGGEVEMQNFGTVGNGYNLYEGCENYYIFSRTDTTDLSFPVTVNLTITGTTTPGQDYILTPPGTLTIPVGQISTTLFYEAVFDNTIEGIETMIFTLTATCPCGGAVLQEVKDTVYVYDNPELQVYIDQPDTLICSTQTQQLTLKAVTNTHPTITHFLWDNGSTDSIRIVNPPTGAITTYTVTVTDECGQFMVDDVTITVSDMSTISITTVDLVCNGVCSGEVEVLPDNGFAPFTYTWLPNGTGSINSGIATNLCAGNYSITVSDQFGCTADGNFVINEPPNMFLTFTQTPATCAGASDGTLTTTIHNGQAPFTFTCSTQPTSITQNGSTVTWTNMPAGNYTVNVEDAYGCDVTDITVVDELALAYTIDMLPISCHGGKDGQITVNLTGGTQPYNYEWSNGMANSATISNLGTGTYILSVIDDHDCKLNIPVFLEEPDTLLMDIAPDTTMCIGEDAFLWAKASGGTPPYSVNWSEGTIADTIIVAPVETSTYEVYITDDHGCKTFTGEVVVNLFPEVTADIYTSTSKICSGDSALIYAEITGGNGGPYTLGLASGEIVESPFYITPYQSTIITAYAGDKCGSPIGISTLPITVIEPEAPSFSLDIDSGCAPLSVKFTLDEYSDAASYLWNFGDEGDHGYSSMKEPVHTYENPGEYDIKLEIRTKEGCQANSYSVSPAVKVFESPEASFLAVPKAASIIRPNIDFENQTTGIFDSYWDFDDGDTSIIESPQHVFSDTGFYNVRLIVTNQNNCTDTIIETIHIKGEFTFWAPNAFNPNSPNSDNAIFKLYGVGFSADEFHLIVYDRWGAKVFETFSIEHGWNGTINNSANAAEGAYPWVLKYKDQNGGSHTQSGSVTLVR